MSRAVDIVMQGTIKGTVSFKGRGLHTGKRSHITVYAADENTGILFKRIDKAGKNTEILAHWKNTKKLPLCTCIASPENGVHVRTIEHLMAAFYACGIDNALVEVDGSELPIMDGSSEPFIKEISKTGIVEQESPRKIFRLKQKFEVSEAGKSIIIEPAESLTVDVTISLQKIGRLNWSGEVTPELFSKQIAPARTFGRLKNGLLAQLTRFSKDPICLGANTRSALVVVRGDKVLNKGGLRMPNEYVRHRVLDLMGDLMLSGGHVHGKITAISPAHRLTHQLLQQILNNDLSES
ncbi:MAG: UDP-3-O-[3-hydroxymyristoyl] N-acetylglucosamine deacetylase [Thiotrichaceae bacterium]|nr:UDP-3-O-[3-hydroxymyristoyl] N-acetylglucosamine deacetylase [Thiotrichaceae bacterium]